METRLWFKQVEKKGWRVSSVSGLVLNLSCNKLGCDGCLTLPLANLGPTPPPCSEPHEGQYSAHIFEEYSTLVKEMVRRRCSLGLDQADLNNAMGVADGYISKLESFARIATFPTLILWAQTLGLSLVGAPAPLPAATLRAIEHRQAKPYQPNQARFK